MALWLRTTVVSTSKLLIQRQHKCTVCTQIHNHGKMHKLRNDFKTELQLYILSTNLLESIILTLIEFNQWTEKEGIEGNPDRGVCWLLSGVSLWGFIRLFQSSNPSSANMPPYSMTPTSICAHINNHCPHPSNTHAIKMIRQCQWLKSNY